MSSFPTLQTKVYKKKTWLLMPKQNVVNELLKYSQEHVSKAVCVTTGSIVGI